MQTKLCYAEVSVKDWDIRSRRVGLGFTRDYHGPGELRYMARPDWIGGLVVLNQ